MELTQQQAMDLPLPPFSAMIKKDEAQIIGFCIENLEVESKHTGGFYSVYLLSHRPT